MHLIVMLAVFLALGAADAVRQQPDAAIWGRSLQPSATLALLAGTLLLVWTLLHWLSRHVLTRLDHAADDPARTRRAARLAARSDLLGRWLALLTSAALLTVGGWARLVEIHWRLDRFLLADEAALLAPFIAMIVAHWLTHYPVNRRVREWVMMGQLAEGLAARPVWSRRQYLSFQLRNALAIVLAPIAIIIATYDAAALLAFRYLSPQAAPWAAQIAAVAAALAVFLLGPLLLRRIWVTTPLPPGPLRDQLETLCQRIRLGYREILLWRTHSAVANAAVMGLIPNVRFVLLSDAVVEQVSDEQIEAIFGHEAGHVKHHHMLYLGLLILAGGALAMIFGEAISQLVAHLLLARADSPQHAQTLLNSWGEYVLYAWLALVVLAAFLVFGYVSRRFERQADVYAARAVAGQLNPPARDETLQPRGAWAMGAALVRIALLNGIPVDARSWRHSSIASRAAFLRRLTDQPGLLRRYTRQLWLIKLAILLALALSIAGLSVLYYLSQA